MKRCADFGALVRVDWIDAQSMSRKGWIDDAEETNRCLHDPPGRHPPKGAGGMNQDDPVAEVLRDSLRTLSPRQQARLRAIKAAPDWTPSPHLSDATHLNSAVLREIGITRAEAERTLALVREALA